MLGSVVIILITILLALLFVYPLESYRPYFYKDRRVYPTPFESDVYYEFGVPADPPL